MGADVYPGELGRTRLTLMQSLKRSLKETFVVVDPNDNLTLSVMLHRTDLGPTDQC